MDEKMVKEISIVDVTQEAINGVRVKTPKEDEVYRNTYFEWRGSTLPVSFDSDEVCGGYLKAWHHLPLFQKLEYHEDYEKFIFLKGTALMPFADVIDGKVDMNSVQIVRITPGVQIVVEPYKAHFIPVAESDEPVEAVIISPVMPYIHVYTDTPVMGILLG